MANKAQMWGLWAQAKTYAVRPSRLLRVFDEWAAYQLDAAVLYLGTWVESKLADLDKDGQPKHRLEDLLADADEEADVYDAIGQLTAIPGAVSMRRKAAAKAPADDNAEA